MADTATQNGTKDAVPAAVANSNTPSGLPPIVKEPMTVDGAAATGAATGASGGATAPMVPVNPVTQTEKPAVDAPTNAPPAVPDAPAPAMTNGSGTKSSETTTAKADVTGKMDAADALAKQPENGTEEHPRVADAPMDDDIPKPVTVEEVRDEALPKKPEPEAEAATEKPESAAVPAAPEPEVEEKPESQTGEKRKLEEEEEGDAKPRQDEEEKKNGAAEPATAADDDDASKPEKNGVVDGEQPAEKKLKTNGDAAKKPGRPRKDKKAAAAAPAAPAGRTQRKTRSQGNAD